MHQQPQNQVEKPANATASQTSGPICAPAAHQRAGLYKVWDSDDSQPTHAVNPYEPSPHDPGLLSYVELQERFAIAPLELKAIQAAGKRFQMKITPYYADLMQQHPELSPIVVPSALELVSYEDDTDTDVHTDESKYQPVEGIVHRYPGKLLFFPTLQCLGHCRFCFRAGHRVKPLSSRKIEAALDYIRSRPDVREVLVTGGDPLTLPLEALEEIIAKIREIRHIQIIRVGTRAPAYAPEVFTPQMVSMFAKYNPVFMTFSFVHPAEITPYCEQKLNMMADAGIVMLQQGPLLKDINDDPAVLLAMYEKLARNRVLAYYAIYGIYAPGVRHFIVDRQKAKTVFMQMENNTSGYCLPHLITLDQNEDKTRSVM